MHFREILITGGAGFVGSHLALCLKRDYPGTAVTAFDNLSRRGSELNIPRLSEGGVRFARGDVTSATDLGVLPAFDLLIDCAAEPSVHGAAMHGPAAVVNSNLVGSLNSF